MLVLNSRSKTCGGVFAAGPTKDMAAALQTRMSTAPKAVRAASASRSMSSSRSMSQAAPLAMTAPSPNSVLSSTAVRSHSSLLRLEMTTRAPCRASSRATPRPIPLVAPVTTATLPVKSKAVIVSGGPGGARFHGDRLDRPGDVVRLQPGQEVSGRPLHVRRHQGVHALDVAGERRLQQILVLGRRVPRDLAARRFLEIGVELQHDAPIALGLFMERPVHPQKPGIVACRDQRIVERRVQA